MIYLLFIFVESLRPNKDLYNNNPCDYSRHFCQYNFFSKKLPSFINTFSFKNRIINGDMRIDQRAVGVETRGTATSGATYTVDRWYTIKNGAGQAFTVQKSSDVPANQIFKNSVLITITETDSVISAGEYNIFGQNIEG